MQFIRLVFKGIFALVGVFIVGVTVVYVTSYTYQRLVETKAEKQIAEHRLQAQERMFGIPKETPRTTIYEFSRTGYFERHRSYGCYEIEAFAPMAPEVWVSGPETGIYQHIRLSDTRERSEQDCIPLEALNTSKTLLNAYTVIVPNRKLHLVNAALYHPDTNRLFVMGGWGKQANASAD